MQILDIDICTPDDLDALCAIEEACFDMPWQRHSIAYDLDNQGAVVYIKASAKAGPVGYAVIAMDEGMSHLMNIAVLPEFRSQGVASQLMLAAEVISTEWGYKRMCLEVRGSNRHARDLYSKMGFIYRSRKTAYYANGEDALVLAARFPLKIVERELDY